MSNALTFLLLTLFIASCGSYKKSCTNGVCTVTENGVTRYEGDPKKIAALKAKNNKDTKDFKQFMSKVNQLPKRTSNEIIRVTIYSPRMDQSYSSFQQKLHELIVRELQQYPNIQIVDEKIIMKTLNPQNNFGSSLAPKGYKQVGSSSKMKFNKSMVQKIRMNHLPVDVIIQPMVKKQSQMGMVKGSKSTVAQVQFPYYIAYATSAFHYKPFKLGTKGGATSLAGVDLRKSRKSKGRSGELNFTLSERGQIKYIKVFTEKIHTAIMQRVLPTLLKLAELKKIEPKRGVAATPDNSLQKKTDKLNKKLKDMFTF